MRGSWTRMQGESSVEGSRAGPGKAAMRDCDPG